MPYDKIIIGAGLYGLYAARFCGRRGEKVLVLEKDSAPFMRATSINQARVHMGYHYPRSISTALRCAQYFDRFVEDFPGCIKQDFEQIYATGAQFSWTSAMDFQKFCEAAGIHCEEAAPGKYFKPGMCDGAFLTKEYTYDAAMLRRKLVEDLATLPSVQIRFSNEVCEIAQKEDLFEVTTGQGELEQAPYILNASYASINGLASKLGFDPFAIKYELCEMILCKVSAPPLRDTGLTVMDGPFFSIMPFGFTGMHSLTSVNFTPHLTSTETLPTFPCQEKTNGACTPENLANCNDCPQHPDSAWPSMSQLAKKYLRDDLEFTYKGSLFSMKPIPTSSEIDDARPTVIRVMHENPTFVSVLSGKINTVYDLEEVL